MATSINLKSILVPSKDTEVEYPGMPDLKLNLCFLSRESLQALRKKATKTVFKNRQPVDEVNDELFLDLYVQATIKGWSGFKIKYVEQLAPIDTSSLDPEDLLEFNAENALLLMRNSAAFDSFVSETVTDLANFSKSK